ncbi:MAG: Flp pilus assembly complex ATPase component TadA [Proteobacteria bacterium]|nr:Flp pilus assembly complex ATPase component TadA [Pseudomonadota bacterium]
MAKRKRLGEMLIDAELINKTQLEKALSDARKSGFKLGQYLIKKAIVTEKAIVNAIAEQVKIKKFNPTDYSITSDLSKFMDIDTVNRFQAIPLEKKGGILAVAMVDPLDILAIDHIEILTDMEVIPVICTEQNFNDLLSTIFGAYAGKDGVMRQIQDIEEMDVVDEKDSYPDQVIESALQNMAEEAPVIRLVNSILAQAVREGATDLHISPEKEYMEIRLRVDGKLHHIPAPPKRMFLPLVSRIKILANIDISVSRIPQDGRLTIIMNHKEVNIRVSTIPTVYGQNLVLRLLDTSSGITTLEKIGLSENDIHSIKRNLALPYGMILCTGPTGSGKSTSLFAMLSEINQPHTNIITLEDPVEYRMEHIRQVQLNHKAGMTFASGLRSILRQDPDAVMIGEIRDSETSRVAIQAALTGHMVFSTVHTNDSTGAITRLVDMGVERFLIASVLLVTIAQRLVRRVCPYCKKLYKPSDKELKFWGLENRGPVNFARATGCSQCMDTGYKGRIGIYEILYMDDDIREMILQGKSAQDIAKFTTLSGRMKTLKMDAAEKVFNGDTTGKEAVSAIMAH